MTFKDLVTGPSGALALISTVVVPLIVTLSFGVFIWGVVKYLFLHGSEEKSREEGRWFMLWGIMGLALLFSTWTIVKFLLSTLGIL